MIDVDGPGHDLGSSIARSDFGSHHWNRHAQQLPERGKVDPRGATRESNRVRATEKEVGWNLEAIVCLDRGNVLDSPTLNPGNCEATGEQVSSRVFSNAQYLVSECVAAVRRGTEVPSLP